MRHRIRLLLTGLGILFPVVLLIIVALPGTRDAIGWRSARKTDTLQAYRSYLSAWPRGVHRQEASRLMEERFWTTVLTNATIPVLEDYLMRFPAGAYSSNALYQLEDLRWQQAAATNSVFAYDKYVEQYPEGRHTVECKEKLFRRMHEVLWDVSNTTFERDAEYRYQELSPETQRLVPAAREVVRWREATNFFTESAFKSYLERYPTGTYSLAAKELIEEVKWNAATNPPLPPDSTTVHVFTRGETTQAAEETARSLERQLAQLEGMRSYAEANPQGKYVRRAVESLDALRWGMTTNAGSDLAKQFFRGMYVQGRLQPPWKGKQAAEMHRFARLYLSGGPTRVTTNLYRILCLSRYVDDSPNGKHVAAAKAELEDLEWSVADCPRALIAFMTNYPTSPHTSKCPKLLQQMRADDTEFLRLAKDSNSDIGLWRTFLDDNPGHFREAELKTAVEEIETNNARDLTTLIALGKVETAPRGAGISSVALSVQRKTPYPLNIKISAGTYFVSANPSAQNMIAIKDSIQTLWKTEWTPLYASVACANRTRSIPTKEVTFSVQRPPVMANAVAGSNALFRVTRALAGRSLSFNAAQAAVWIITDDATYDELGILKAGQYGGRLIGPIQVGEAMQVIAEAGLDIKRLKIWDARGEVIDTIPDGKLKDWLKNYP